MAGRQGRVSLCLTVFYYGIHLFFTFTQAQMGCIFGFFGWLCFVVKEYEKLFPPYQVLVLLNYHILFCGHPALGYFAKHSYGYYMGAGVCVRVVGSGGTVGVGKAI